MDWIVQDGAEYSGFILVNRNTLGSYIKEKKSADPTDGINILFDKKKLKHFMHSRN
jgi:hypothetical protein